LPASPVLPRPAEVRKSEADRTSETALMLVATHADLKGNKLVEALAYQLSIESAGARNVFETLCERGALYKVRRQGSLYYTTERPADTPAQGVSGRGSVAETEPGLRGYDLKLAQGMLAILASHGRPADAWITPRQLKMALVEHQLADPNLDFGHVRRLMRALHDQNIMVNDIRKSGQRQVFKGRLASRWVRDMLRDPSYRAGIYQLLESGQPLRQPE
jgi:hypothetical protein